MIVRGDIGSAPRRAPVLKVAETHRGTAFTALESWIPAGRIDRFVWSWVEYSGPATSIFSGTQKTLTDQHRFILPKPAGVTSVDRICLRIEGTRIAPNGHTTSVTAGATCHVQEPEFALDLPSWWGPLVLPIWQPDLNDSMPLRDAIAGHISVQADVPRKQPFSRNTLVAFADWSAARPLEALHHALSKTKNAALMVIVVVPEGAFDRSRKEFESKLPGEGFRRAGSVHRRRPGRVDPRLCRQQDPLGLSRQRRGRIRLEAGGEPSMAPRWQKPSTNTRCRSGRRNSHR